MSPRGKRQRMNFKWEIRVVFREVRGQLVLLFRQRILHGDDDMSSRPGIFVNRECVAGLRQSVELVLQAFRIAEEPGLHFKPPACGWEDGAVPSGRQDCVPGGREARPDARDVADALFAGCREDLSQCGLSSKVD